MSEGTTNTEALKRTEGMSNKSRRRLRKQSEAGAYIRLKQGVYLSSDWDETKMIDIDKIVPEGVLCMYTAWKYYELIPQEESEIYVAIERSRKVRLPKFPKIKLVYQEAEVLHVGLVSAQVDGINVQITNIERSVCDAVKYRNKIGLDVMFMILSSYSKRSDKNVNRLMDYASRLRVSRIMSLYMGTNKRK